MTLAPANPNSDEHVQFVVKHTFIDIQGAEEESGTKCRSPTRRKSDIGPARTTHEFIRSLSPAQVDSTNPCVEAENEKPSFVSSVDYDDIIDARSLHLAAEWSTAQVDVTSIDVDTEAEVPSFVSSFNYDDIIAARSLHMSMPTEWTAPQNVSTSGCVDVVADIPSFVSSVADDDIIAARSANMSTEWLALQAGSENDCVGGMNAQSLFRSNRCWSIDSTTSTCTEIPFALCSSISSSISTSADVEQYRRAIATEPLKQQQTSYNMKESLSIPLAAEDENKTTLMVKDLPITLSQADFVNELNERGYRSLFDFVYMPMNLRTGVSFGYAFVNFTSTAVAVQLMSHSKEWEAVWSACQGITANVERYRNSPLMHKMVPADCKPALYDELGLRVPFPAPTVARINKPRIHQNKGKPKENEIQKDTLAKSVGNMCHSSQEAKPQNTSAGNRNIKRGLRGLSSLLWNKNKSFDESA
jgi:hypothetical protein|mmetsp:Transcript_66446/g.105052  ORF Transcript_66446/g.105052 Transcript_66446/m.105052 type:complete len:472 (-) Transcript_66446:91-1506(-)